MFSLTSAIPIYMYIYILSVTLIFQKPWKCREVADMRMCSFILAIFVRENLKTRVFFTNTIWIDLSGFSLFH